MLLDEFYWINNQPDWIKKSYSLNNFLGKSNVQLVLMLYCGGGQTADGIYIDNFSIASTNGIPESGLANSTNTIKVLPNPFSNRTTIEYLLEDDASVYLSIFDYLGKEVEVIINKNVTEGKHQVEWNAEDLPAGIYYCRLQAGNHLMSAKIIKLK
jgi:hypothetical protein